MIFLKNILGILLLPLAWAVWQAFYSSISNVSIFSKALYFFERGVLAYLIFHVFVLRPVYIYVLGHECVHAIAALLSGGRIVSFNVRPSGGSVVTSKTNFFIELSPYFVPIYTVLTTLIYYLLVVMNKDTVMTSSIFVFFVGVTLAFHFAMTSEVLRMGQSDILKSGIIFSFVIIFISNLTVLIGIFTPVFRSVSFLEFIRDIAARSADIYGEIYAAIASLIPALKF